MARITSRKSDRAPGSRNGRSRRDFNGRVMDKFGIVFSTGALILNMSDGERTWSLILDEDETAALATRFAEFQSKVEAR
jgi:uncharacterized protein with von Willebrand factor type A (vWA) domain